MLQEYVLISQNLAQVETFLRQSDKSWRFSAAKGLDASVKISSTKLLIPLKEIYAGVSFPESGTLR